MPHGLPPEELQKYPRLGADMKRREAEAKRLLAEVGYAKGLEVEATLSCGAPYERGHYPLRMI